jgi:hypothetical protein
MLPAIQRCRRTEGRVPPADTHLSPVTRDYPNPPVPRRMFFQRTKEKLHLFFVSCKINILQLIHEEGFVNNLKDQSKR